MTHFKNDYNKTLLLLEVVFMTEQCKNKQTKAVLIGIFGIGFLKKKKIIKTTGKAGHMLCILQGVVRGKFKGLD